MNTQLATPESEEPGVEGQLLAERQALSVRILASESFQNSRKSQQLLQYIVERTLSDSPDECTEQLIGIHVFDRNPGYHAAEDSIVRSQVRLLRQRLDTYFENEGREEALRLKIPRGHYIAVFCPAEAVAQTKPEGGESEFAVVPAPPGAKPEPAPGAQGWGKYAWVIAGLCLLAATAGAAFWAGEHTGQQSHIVEMPASQLWASFFQTGGSPLVIYSNAVFVGNGSRGLRYATGSEPLDEHLTDHYTGVGEVAAVYALTRFFDDHKAGFTLKRSRLVTWDDARSRNLVFVGAPLENPSLQVLPSSQDFEFVHSGDDFDIVNRQPLAGEPLRMNHSTWPMIVDYAIISLRPGLEPGTKILIFSGMTTIGTQAAVEFAVSASGSDQLLPSSIAGSKPYFESVLMATVNSGVPVSFKVIAMHRFR